MCATWPNIRRARRAALRKQPSSSSWWARACTGAGPASYQVLSRAVILWFIIYHSRATVKQLLDQLFQSLFPFSFINCGIAYSITYSSVTSSPSTYYLLRTCAITHYIWKPYENIQMLTITYFSFLPLWFEHDIKSMTISIFIL